MRPLLMLFVKYPEPGRVKTRIAAHAGLSEAAEIYREMVQTVLHRIPENQKLRVLYDDFRPEADYREWLSQSVLTESDAKFTAQAEGDLGNRLTSAFRGAFADGESCVGVIGSDCVELTSDIYQQAWLALKDNDVVIGPTHDGGYYLLALRNFYPELFEGIAWSSETVLQETLKAAAGLSLKVALLPKLNDIDTLADWQRAKISMAGIASEPVIG